MDQRGQLRELSRILVAATVNQVLKLLQDIPDFSCPIESFTTRLNDLRSSYINLHHPLCITSDEHISASTVANIINDDFFSLVTRLVDDRVVFNTNSKSFAHDLKNCAIAATVAYTALLIQEIQLMEQELKVQLESESAALTENLVRDDETAISKAEPALSSTDAVDDRMSSKPSAKESNAAAVNKQASLSNTEAAKSEGEKASHTESGASLGDSDFDEKIAEFTKINDVSSDDMKVQNVNEGALIQDEDGSTAKSPKLNSVSQSANTDVTPTNAAIKQVLEVSTQIASAVNTGLILGSSNDEHISDSDTTIQTLSSTTADKTPISTDIVPSAGSSSVDQISESVSVGQLPGSTTAKDCSEPITKVNDSKTTDTDTESANTTSISESVDNKVPDEETSKKAALVKDDLNNDSSDESGSEIEAVTPLSEPVYDVEHDPTVDVTAEDNKTEDVEHADAIKATLPAVETHPESLNESVSNEPTSMQRTSHKVEQPKKSAAEKYNTPNSHATNEPEVVVSNSAAMDRTDESTATDNLPKNEPYNLSRKRGAPAPFNPQQYKRFQGIATRLITSIQEHRYSLPFLQPVNPRDAPDYAEVIYEPRDLKNILRLVKQKSDVPAYTSIKHLERDIMLMYANCIMYNKSDDDLARMTVSMRDDVDAIFKMYEQAELEI